MSAHQTRARLTGGRIIAPTRLADSAGTYAATLRIDPTTQTSRVSLDLTLMTFLSRLSYLLLIEAWLLLRLPDSAGLSARLLPIAGLAVPAFFAYRFIERLTPPLRTYLLRKVTRTRLRVPIAFTTIGVLLIASTAVLPAGTRSGVLSVAFAAALVGRILVMLQREGTRTGSARDDEHQPGRVHRRRRRARWARVRGVGWFTWGKPSGPHPGRGRIVAACGLLQLRSVAASQGSSSVGEVVALLEVVDQGGMRRLPAE